MQYTIKIRNKTALLRYGYDEQLQYYFIVAESEDGAVFFSNLDFPNPRFSYVLMVEWIFILMDSSDSSASSSTLAQLYRELAELRELEDEPAPLSIPAGRDTERNI